MIVDAHFISSEQYYICRSMIKKSNEASSFIPYKLVLTTVGHSPLYIQLNI